MRKVIKKIGLCLFMSIFALAVLCLAACNSDVTISFLSEGVAVSTITGKAGEDISDRLPANPTREGYVFDGWYEDEACTLRVTLPNTLPDKSKNFYAGWTPAQKATLTLLAGDVGTLADNVFELYVGDNVSRFVEQHSPVPDDDLQFDGWFVGDERLSDELTMPASGLTLTAKYLASYAVNVYRMDTEGKYPSVAQTQTGKATYGEAFEYLSEDEHFYVDDGHEESKHSVESLGKNETFNVYLAREQYTVTFDSNLSDNVVAQSAVYLDVYYEGVVTLIDGVQFGVSDAYRLGGWSDEAVGDNVTSDIGDSYRVLDNKVFFGVWEQAATDIFGGSDYLFVSVKDPSKVYLRRSNIDELCGDYDEDSHLFVFEQDGEVFLDGKLFQGKYYYFKDALQKTYVSSDGSGDTLKLQAHGAAVCSVSGEPVDGSYAVDPDTGDYFFEADEVSFVFELDAVNLTFVKSNAERGYYSLSSGNVNGYPVLHFDGFGGLEMFFPEGTPYVDGNGRSYGSLGGSYEYDETLKVYLLAITAGGDGVARQYVRLQQQQSVLDGYKLSGSYLLGDGYTGIYSDDSYHGKPADLTVDGFGNAVYQGATGTYTVQPLSWSTSMLGAVWEIDHSTVVFIPDDGGKEILFSLFVDSQENEYDYDILSDYPARYFYGNTLIINGLPVEETFLFIRNDGSADNAELWCVSYRTDADVVYESLCSGTLTETDKTDVYLFEGSFFGTDYSHLVVFNEDGTVNYTRETLRLTDCLYIDENGYAVYTPEGGEAHNVDYEIDTVETSVTRYSGYSCVYVVDLDGYIHTFGIGVDGSVTEFKDTDFLDVGYLAFNTFGARLILLGDGKAMLAALMSQGNYQFYFYGNVESLSDDSYRFTLEFSGYPYEDGNSFKDEYSEFQFVTDKGLNGYVFLVYDGKPLSLTSDGNTFAADGYGRAELTIGDDETIDGYYRYLENLIELSTDFGYFYIKTEDNRFTIINLEEHGEAGYFYGITGSYLDTAIRLFFDGDGVAFYTPSSDSEVRKGSYEFTQTVTLDGLDFDEYKLTFEDETIYVITRIVMANNQQMGGFFLRDDASMIDIDVEGGGHILSDGYNISVYTDGDGRILNGYAVLADIVESEYVNHGYRADVNGASIVFSVVNDDLDVVDQLIFDIVDGKAVMRSTMSGVFIRNNGGTRVYENYLYLDGNGRAELRTNYGEYYSVSESGIYESVPEMGSFVYRYTRDTEDGSEPYSFIFELSVVQDFYQYGFAYYYDYRVYNAEEDGVFYGADATVAVLDGFGNGIFIDKYGVTVSGTYAQAYTDNLVEFKRANSSDRLFFYLDADNDGFELIDGDFIVLDGILFAYLGTATEISLSGDIIEIARGAIPNNVNVIEFNKVQKIDDYALQNNTLVAVNAPDVIEVGVGAFSNCYNLQSVELPKAERICDGAFTGCSKLSYIKLAAVSELGATLFDRSNYMSVLTVDLTDVADLTSVKVDEHAFDLNQYSGDFGKYMWYQRICVKDIDAVNTLLGSEAWPDAAKSFVYFDNDDTRMEGVVYFGVDNEVIYRFDKVLIKDTPTANGTLCTEVIGLYSVDEDGNVTVYYKNGNMFATDGTVLDNTDEPIFDGNELLRSGKQYTRTLDGDTLRFTVDVKLTDQNSYMTWNDIYTFGGSAEWRGVGSDDFRFDFAEHTFDFLSAAKAYSVAYFDGDGCTVTELGNVVSVDSSYEPYNPDEFTDVSVTLIVKDGKILSVWQMTEHTGWGTDFNVSIAMTETNDDGTLTLYTGYGYSLKGYLFTYTAADDEGKATLDITPCGLVTEISGDGFYAALKFDGNCEATDVVAFGKQNPDYTYTPWTVNDCSINAADNTVTITVTDTDGVQHSFVAKYTSDGTLPNVFISGTLQEQAA